MKNTLLHWILQNILENQSFHKAVKFSMINSYKMDFMKGIAILKSARKMDLDDQSFCWSLPLNVHTFTTPLLIKGHASSCKRYSCRERV